MSEREAHQPDGSALCLACGLCCEGVIFYHAVIKPGEIEHVRALGLTVVTVNDQQLFLLPCHLYRESRCSIYSKTRPHVCGSFRCELLINYLEGMASLEKCMQIVERARDIYGEILEQLPSGYMFEKVMREFFEDEGESHWLLNSEEARRANVGLLLSIFKLKRYLGKNFKKNKGKAKRDLFD